MSARKKKDSGTDSESRNDMGGDQQSPQSWEPEHLFETERKAGDGVGIVESLQQQVDNLRSQLARSQADFANLRRRSRDEQTRTVIYANESLVSNLLPVLDDFWRALSANSDNGGNGGKDFADGMGMIKGQLDGILEREGLEPLSVVGGRFDPFLHEAVLTRQEEGAEPGSILEECQTGYLFQGRLLRAAQVIVVPGSSSAGKRSTGKKAEAEAEAEVEIEVEIEIEADPEAPPPPEATPEADGEEFDAAINEEKTTPTVDPEAAFLEAEDDAPPVPEAVDEDEAISEESENTFVSPTPSGADWEMEENLLDGPDDDS